MPRRSRSEIYIEVLQAINDGVSAPTRIMYAANISWQPNMDALNHLVKNELIEELDAREESMKAHRKVDKRSTVVYVITQKGKDALRQLAKSRSMMDTR